MLLDRILEEFEQRVVIPLLAFLLAFITIGVFIQVVMRYVFSMSFLWGEELSLFAFIWSVFLGAAVGVRRRIHLGFDFLPDLLTGRWADAQRILIDLSILGVALLLLVEGWSFSLLSVQRLSPALGISLFVPTLVIPISGGLMLIVVLRDLARDVRQLLARPEPLMDPLLLLFGSLTVTLVVGMPIAFALTLSSLLVIWYADLPLIVAVQQMFHGINGFTLLALPFFFLAGSVMTIGGISERLVKLAMAMVGHLRGGLAHVNVVVGMFLSGISGIEHGRCRRARQHLPSGDGQARL